MKTEENIQYIVCANVSHKEVKCEKKNPRIIQGERMEKVAAATQWWWYTLIGGG